MSAAVQTRSRGPIRIHFEGLGLTVTLPSAETLAFVTGVGVIAAAGLLEWPIAAVLAIARLLTSATGSAILQGLGDALALIH
jgi:hypothetical protein